MQRIHYITILASLLFVSACILEQDKIITKNASEIILNENDIGGEYIKNDVWSKEVTLDWWEGEAEQRMKELGFINGQMYVFHKPADMNSQIANTVFVFDNQIGAHKNLELFIKEVREIAISKDNYEEIDSVKFGDESSLIFYQYSIPSSDIFNSKEVTYSTYIIQFRKHNVFSSLTLSLNNLSKKKGYELVENLVNKIQARI